MSSRMTRQILTVAVMTLLIGGAAAGSAAAVSGSASGSVSVFVPAALKPHELCVSSATTGTVCEDVPGTPAVTLDVSFVAAGNITPPSASVTSCPGGAIVTVASGGGTLSGSATVSGPLMPPVTVAIGPETTPGDTVTVSFCETA